MVSRREPCRTLLRRHEFPAGGLSAALGMEDLEKMTMNQGVVPMRAEFERLAPLMKPGGFASSVDHQTRPGLWLEQCRSCVRLLEESTQA